MRRSLRSPLIAAAVLALVLAACGSGTTKTATKTSKVSTLALLSSAPEKAADAGSARFEMKMEMSVDDADVSMAVDGAIDFENNGMVMQMSMRDLAPDAPDLDIEARMVDGVVYMNMDAFAGALGGKSPFGDKPWIKIDASELAGEALPQQQNPADMLESLRGIGDIAEVGRARVRGVDTTEYRGEIDMGEALAALDPEARKSFGDVRDLFGSSRVPVRVWVDDEGLPRRFALELSMGGGTGTIEMEFFDFGVEVDVEAPPADEVSDMSRMLDPSAIAA